MQTVAIEPVQMIKGVPYPAGDVFRRVIVTGPPGSGKTTLIEQLGGWPGEGFLDLAGRGWWRSPLLSYRPREVHLGLPFEGMSESHAVFDPEWLEAPAALALGRIVLPPERRRFWQFDWRRRYLFDFLLPPPATIHAIRTKRRSIGTHPVDVRLTPEIVQRQHDVYAEVARHLSRHGVPVIVRLAFQGPPHYVL